MAIDMKAIYDSQRTLVMGVLNITEDSFSDGGLWLAPEAAKAHGEAMMKAGADIIDIGAESTRPGAKRVSEADEKARVLGAVDALIPEGAVLSIARFGGVGRARTWRADHQRRVRRPVGPRTAACGGRPFRLPVHRAALAWLACRRRGQCAGRRHLPLRAWRGE